MYYLSGKKNYKILRDKMLTRKLTKTDNNTKYIRCNTNKLKVGD